MRRRIRSSLSANSFSSASASAICLLNVSSAMSRRSTWAGRPSASCKSVRRTLLGRLSGVARSGPMRDRTYLRIRLTNCVRALTSVSRDTQMAFTSWLTADGMWTDGTSMRQEASLSIRASRTSFFKPRWPTPECPHQRRSDYAHVMSLPWRLAGNSERLGARLEDDTRPRSTSQQSLEKRGAAPDFLHDFASPVPNADLTVATVQIDADMLHGPVSLRAQYPEPC